MKKFIEAMVFFVCYGAVLYLCVFMAFSVLDSSVLLPVFIFGLAAANGLTVSNTYSMARVYEKSTPELFQNLNKIGNKQYSSMLLLIQAGLLSILALPLKGIKEANSTDIISIIVALAGILAIMVTPFLVFLAIILSISNIVIIKEAINNDGSITVDSLSVSEERFVKKFRFAFDFLRRNSYLITSETKEGK